ncbi:3-isopropylmalate dehydrogenase [Lecanosticta acicola]|uniref:3-isopropylmalate dehydrogenase n=1 Tax=Lecanosticta acicola TaxID=111012 RepID=A0AAI8YSS1_9PEZI|nr:3-isopropylmalate dehydrogenase [Lecanosticta acicola]
MADRASLLTIPAEMQQAIAEVADNPSLLALRLVSRELRAAADDPFLERFFTVRKHVMTTYGLAALLQISTRPHLTRKLKEIVLAFVEPNIGDYWCGKDRPESYMADEMLRYIRRDEWNQAKDDLFLCQRAESLLIAILKSLRGHDLKLTIVDGCREDFATAFGLQHLKRSFGVERSGFQEEEPPHDCTALLSSIAVAAFPVAYLGLYFGFYEHGSMTLSYGMQSLAFKKRSWSSLRKLDVTIADFGDDWTDRAHMDMLAFIRAANKIEDVFTFLLDNFDLSRFSIVELGNDKGIMNIDGEGDCTRLFEDTDAVREGLRELVAAKVEYCMR